MENTHNNPASLITRLELIRNKIRSRLIFYGVSAVLAGGLISLLTIILLDYLLWLPGFARIIILFFFVLGFILATIHWIITPLRHPITLDEIAGKLEEHFSHLNDRLISTVDFLRGNQSGSEELRNQLIHNTDKLLHNVNFEKSLTIQPVMTKISSLLVAGVLFCSIFIAAPGYIRTGVERYLDPLGPLEWPRNQFIESISGDKLIAEGDSVEVRMQVTRGFSEGLRGVVHFSDENKNNFSRTMRHEANGVYTTTINSITESLEYWFEAGDNNTEKSPHFISITQRPAIISTRLSISPPEYASIMPVSNTELKIQQFEMVKGSIARMTLITNKPVNQDLSHLQLEDGTKILPLKTLSNDNILFELSPESSTRFSIHLTDLEGFSSKQFDQYFVIIKEDKKPSIVLINPQGLVESTLSGLLSYEVDIFDDLGIQSIEMSGKNNQGEYVYNQSFPVTADYDSNKKIFRTKLEQQLKLFELKPIPGDVYTFTIIATDEFKLDSGAYRSTRSNPIRVKIISDIDLDFQLQESITKLRALLMQVQFDQKSIENQSEKLLEKSVLDDDAKRIIQSEASKQLRLSRKMDAIRNQFEKIKSKIDSASPDNKNWQDKIENTIDTIEDKINSSMLEAVSRLNDSADTEKQDDSFAKLEQAVDAQNKAAKSLSNLIQDINEWGNYKTLISRARDILERQRDLRFNLESYIQKKLTDVSHDENDVSQQRYIQTQEQIQIDVDQLLANMNQTARKIQEKDPAAAASIFSSIRRATSTNLAKHIQDARQAIIDKRMAAGTIHQKNVESGLQAMIDALRDRDKRELALLRKRTRQAREQIEQLMKEQLNIELQTNELITLQQNENDDNVQIIKNGYIEVVEQQKQQKTNTESIAQEIINIPKITTVGDLVSQAVPMMELSTFELSSEDGSASLVFQEQIIEQFQAALDELERIDKESEKQEMALALQEIEESLKNILSHQKNLHEDLSEFTKANKDKTRLSRLENRQANKLAQRQSDVIKLTDDLSPTLEKVVVYKWALTRCFEWMTDIKDALLARTVSDSLVTYSQRIIDELEILLQAIEETRSMPTNEQFAEQQGSGGSGEMNNQANQKPVPTIAELLVLKNMQEKIYKQTIAISRNFDPDFASEEEIQTVQQLGEDQKQLQELTKTLTEKARNE